ncbi:MAG: BspA family leucine-rich repeat surface protein, partial [Romboutsia sp.]|nr:BspA family leucine-rich repeat surface protein [Romboutsia sp.]
TVQNVYNAPDVDFTYSVDEVLTMFDIGSVVNSKMEAIASGETNFRAFKKGNSLPNGFTPTTANTVSKEGSLYPIYIWYDSTTNTVYYYSQDSDVYLNSNSSTMFDSTNLADISGAASLNASRVTNMNNMFYGTAITNVDALSNWDVSRVQTMVDMFQASDVSDISGLSNWNTASLVDTKYMFRGSKLVNLDALSNWDMSHVTDISGMFRSVYGATDLDINGINNWDTSSVTAIGDFLRKTDATGTMRILNNPTDYHDAFTSTGGSVVVNYDCSKVTVIDSIVATGSPNVTKGTCVTAPASSGSGSVSPATYNTTLSFTGAETVSNTYTVSKSTTINLANMGFSFTEPGNYNFSVRETATSDNAYPTTNTEYTIVICVRNELNANNRPTGDYTATYYIKDTNDNKVNSMSFAHVKDESYFGHLEISKRVKGMMGSPNKYFDFTVQVDNATGGTCSSYSGSEKYPVTGVDTGHFSAAEVTKCKSGTKDSVSLKHGQTAKIGQFTYNNVNYDSISIDDYYKIVEANESDYVTTFKIGIGSATSGRDTSSQSVSAGTNSIYYYIEREFRQLSGIFINILH